MLSGSSWNALLKTIEEPPPYAVFFFNDGIAQSARNDQSRCQRFDFKRIENEKLEARIVHLAEREGYRSDRTS